MPPDIQYTDVRKPNLQPNMGRILLEDCPIVVSTGTEYELDVERQVAWELNETGGGLMVVGWLGQMNLEPDCWTKYSSCPRLMGKPECYQYLSEVSVRSHGGAWAVGQRQNLVIAGMTRKEANLNPSLQEGNLSARVVRSHPIVPNQ